MILRRGILRDRTLTAKVVLGFVMIIIINTLTIGAVLYYRSLSYVQTEKNLYGESLSRNVSTGVDAVLGRMDRVARILIGDPDIQAILVASQRPTYTITDQLNDASTISKLLLSLTSFQDHVVVAFYNAEGQPLDQQPEAFSAVPHTLFSNEWLLLNRWRIDDRELFFVPAYRSETMLAGGEKSFYVIRALTRIEDNTIIGYVTVAADARVLDAVARQNIPAGRKVGVDVVDWQGRIAVSNDRSAIGKRYDANARGYDVYQTLSAQTGLVTSVNLPPTYIAADLRSVQSSVAFIIFITMLGSLALSLVLSSLILRPLRSFAGSMARVAEGNFEISLPEEGLDADMARLHRGFNCMVREIRRLIHDVYEQSLLAKSAQLEALQYQINPHFLYNTLQTMEAIGEVYSVREIKVISAALAKLFRYNIEPTRTVALGEEIAQVETYLEIERIRFGDSLELRKRIDPELSHCRVLKFILQPVVENSIVHGFHLRRSRPFVIEITAERMGGALHLIVRDSGRGATEEAAGRLLGMLCGQRESGRTDTHEIGLANVHRRIVSLYGPGFGLAFPREEGWGMVVRISMPVVMGERNVEEELQPLDHR